MKKFATLLAAGCLFWCFGAGEITTANNSAQERSPQPSYSATLTSSTKSTWLNIAMAETANTLIEKRRDLLKRCQEAIKAISKMQPQQQRQMAALASEADGGLKASGRILSGMIKVPNPNAPKQMLDDVEFFVTEITHCIESEKQKKACSLSADAKGVLKSFTETDKAQALRSLSTFCKE